MKHLFVVNPTAGGKDKSIAVSRAVRAAFENREGEYEVYVTRGPMDAADKVRRDAKECEHLRVYACGGDGTFNECVCGAALLENTAVCPFPTGTGNDFCRMFGEEKDLFRDLNALLDGTEHPIDLIECNGRYSANICSVGIDARIGTNAHKYPTLPLLGGAGAYVAAAAIEMWKGIARLMHITAEGFDVRGEFTLACACNGRFYGGGFNPSLDARPDDGELDMFIVKKVNLAQFAVLIGRYASGHAAEMTKFVTHLKGSWITIEFEDENVINLDGEALFTKKAEMKVLPGAVRLIVPRGMSFFDERQKKEV